jgi:hypothetical protein
VFIDVYQPLNVMRDDSCDDAIGVLSDTGRYHTSTTFNSAATR